MSPFSPDGSNKRIAHVFSPLLVSMIILASEVAAICSLNFSPIRGMFGFEQGWQSWLPFLIVAPLAGLLAGLPGWQRYVIQAERVTIQRGILVGCLVSIVAHPIMWTGITLFGFLWDIFTLQFTGAALVNVGGLLTLIAASLIYTGWITTIVGGIAGALLICLQRALTQYEESPDKDV
ncbi:MAG: hypothetical protein H0V70_05150 [Ktedonobacteraceae bacterium]|nr:hypothetical protein [Ktedonobacteraceae bacterium]